MVVPHCFSTHTKLSVWCGKPERVVTTLFRFWSSKWNHFTFNASGSSHHNGVHHINPLCDDFREDLIYNNLNWKDAFKYACWHQLLAVALVSLPVADKYCLCCQFQPTLWQWSFLLITVWKKALWVSRLLLYRLYDGVRHWFSQNLICFFSWSTVNNYHQVKIT